MDKLMDSLWPPTHLWVGVAVSPHVATLVHNPVDHDADPLLPVHVQPLEHLAHLAPDLLLLPDALHHLLAHQLQQVSGALHLAPGQACAMLMIIYNNVMRVVGEDHCGNVASIVWISEYDRLR